MAVTVIALDAFYILITQLNVWLAKILQIIWPTMSISTCFIAMAPNILILEASSLMPLAIGIDRFLNTFFPLSLVQFSFHWKQFGKVIIFIEHIKIYRWMFDWLF